MAIRSMLSVGWALFTSAQLAACSTSSGATPVDASVEAASRGDGAAESGSDGMVDSGGAPDASADAGAADVSAPCQAAQVPCDGGCADRCLVTLATGQLMPTAIAVDSSNVYWSNAPQTGAGAVMKCAVAGGTPATFASAPLVYGIALDADYVYWLQYGSGLLKAPIAGGTPQTLASTMNAHALAKGASGLYWSEGVLQAVMGVGLDGGAVTTLASGFEAYGVGVSTQSVYFTSIGAGVDEVSLGGGIPLSFAGGGGALAVDSAGVYCNTGTGSSIVGMGLSGGNIVTLATYSNGYTPLAAVTIAVDGKNVYWTQPGGVMKVPVGGGAVTTLAAIDLSQSPLGIAVDDTSVYWTSMDVTTDVGTVTRLTPK